jgi:DUF2075 family protein
MVEALHDTEKRKKEKHQEVKQKLIAERLNFMIYPYMI